MTLIQDRNLRTGIAGSLAIHGVLLLFLAWEFSVNAIQEWQRRSESNVKVEKEVTLLFPEQILPPEPPPPPPKPEMKAYIRTTQNKAAEKAPVNARFASDRSTVAASRKGPAPDATVNMPSMDGIAPRTTELANRDFRDGQIKNDAAGATPPPVPQMLPPQAPSPPPSLAKPEPARPKAEPPSPSQVAKAEMAPKSLPKMLEDADKDAPRLEMKPPALKIREREEPPMESPPAPAPAPVPGKAATAVPAANSALNKTAGQPEKDAFAPLTRTSAVRGTISNRGDDAVDAEGTPMGVYMRSVTSSVEKKWHVYRMLKKDAVTYGSLRIRFYVKKNGKVEDLKIISDPRDADPRLADFTLRAIKDAEIPPIPADLLPLLDGERVKIEYDVLIY